MERFQPWPKQLMAIALVFVASAGMARAALTSAYLPWVGPPPLRFASLTTPSVEAKLPPLQLTNPIPRTTEPIRPNTPNTGPTVSSIDTEAIPMPDFLGPLDATEPVMPSPGPMLNYKASMPITSESLVMLLRARGTNAAAGTVVFPVFIPPAPPATPASSATYHSAPAPP